MVSNLPSQRVSKHLNMKGWLIIKSIQLVHFDMVKQIILHGVLLIARGILDRRSMDMSSVFYTKTSLRVT